MLNESIGYAAKRLNEPKLIPVRRSVGRPRLPAAGMFSGATIFVPLT